MHSQINFGYPWPLSYGHLMVAAIFGAILALGWMRKWNKIFLAVIGLVTLWACSSFVMVRFGVDINGRGSLPTEAFLKSGTGRVLDMGAGTGRSSLMVLEARPHTTVVALDSFSQSYDEHFGDDGKKQALVDLGRERLMANMRAAGVEQRIAIQPGDMRKMPLESNSFDAIVSAYAIDHLGGEGSDLALREAYRVLKPGGEFLMMVVAKDFWLTYTFGPLLVHMRQAGPDYWETKLRKAGFEIIESGHRPITHYVLSRKPGV